MGGSLNPKSSILRAMAGCLALMVGSALASTPAATGPLPSHTLARALQQDPGNANLHVLRGLERIDQFRAGDRQWLLEAETAFDTGRLLDPNAFWALYWRGVVALERQQTQTALEVFMRAAVLRPQRWEPLYGMTVASLRTQRPDLARMAAEAMLARAPQRADVLAAASYAMAMAGDQRALELSRQASAQPGSDATVVPAVARMLQVAMQPAPAQGAASPTTASAPADAVPRQIAVDVAILLNSVTKEGARGVNLLDGLNAQFGYENRNQQTRIGDAPDPATRVITRAISIPQLNYNLNLFNDAGQYYQVLARPTLTAFLGRESEFFAGRQVQVEVSGVNLGSLQPIDVGVALKITPEEITADRVRFAINAERSFLSRNEIGRFERSLTTFKQHVSATAEVAFGQSLLLSSLSESVRDDTRSATPLLGDIPVVRNLFSRRTTSGREESLLILVTPRPVATFAAPPVSNASMQALAQLWVTRIDPRTDLGEIVRRINHVRVLHGVERDRVSLAPLLEPGLVAEARTEAGQVHL